MKKSLLLAGVVLLAACSQISGVSNNGSADSSQAKMKACLLTEANSRYQAGTLFTSGIKETATDLVKTCMKKLALESAGISSESQSTAESIISNLKSLSNAK
ncbi:MAG: hypothetical protein IJ870_04980 [Alphaproteobacteria bacterium]|nr:hypothetical protein [Alphaproteobacteria bacterium]